MLNSYMFKLCSTFRSKSFTFHLCAHSTAMHDIHDTFFQNTVKDVNSVANFLLKYKLFQYLFEVVWEIVKVLNGSDAGAVLGELVKSSLKLVQGRYSK